MHYEKKIMWSISGNVIDFEAKCPRTVVEIRESIRKVVLLPSSEIETDISKQ